MIRFAFLLFVANVGGDLLCYNGTVTHVSSGEDLITFKGLLSPSWKAISQAQCQSTLLCKGDGAMCFVRSWSARARHSWILQRGCYLPEGSGSKPKSQLEQLATTAPMSCLHHRLRDAEYRACMCRTNWCNSAKSLFVDSNIYFLYIVYLLIASNVIVPIYV